MTDPDADPDVVLVEIVDPIRRDLLQPTSLSKYIRAPNDWARGSDGDA
jgi:hypothetical protein